MPYLVSGRHHEVNPDFPNVLSYWKPVSITHQPFGISSVRSLVAKELMKLIIK